MRPDNGWYGHKFALASYLQKPTAPPIWGYLQHGWTLRGPGIQGPTVHTDRLRKLVWSRRNLLASRHEGLTNVAAIGAPFLYLRPDALCAEETPRGTIVYPFHSWRPGESTIGDHAAFAGELREREGESTTVCLYWLDFKDSAVRQSYAQQGLRVVTHGHRDDPLFLVRQVIELGRHRRVVSNVVSTALWYGAWLGSDIEVYGPHMWLPSDPDPLSRRREETKHWPDLFAGPLKGEEARQLAAAELGAEYVRGPEELVDLLGWGPVRRSLSPLGALFQRVKWRLATTFGRENVLPY